MEGRGKSRRRNPFKVWKRRMGAVMSVILTISIIFNMPLSLADFGLHVSNAYASGSNANREDSVWATASNARYKAGSTRDVDIYVVAEDSEAAAGNMSTMTLYLRNNTQEEISDGILKFKGNHIAKEDGYFTDIQADADAEVSVISGGTDDETEASGEGLLYQEGTLEAAGAGNLDGNADGDDANVAAAGAEMSGNAAEMSANTAERASDDADIDVDDPDADDPDAENPEDEFDEIDEGDEADEVDENDEEENHTLTDISLAPGELYEVRFEFYTDEEEKSTKAYVKFTFEGEGSERKVKGEEKFYYSIGLLYVNIELADGYEIETGVQNEMNIWMSEPTWMDEALEERVEAIEEAKAEAEENESESDETEETAIATKSTADKASDSNADLAQPDAEQSDAQQSGTQQSNGQQSGTQQSDAQASADDTSDKEKIEKFTQEAMTISESKVSYEVEVWGAEYKKFRPKKAEEAEDIGWISCLYQVAENTRPGVYYGKVSASGKWNQKAFASQQGFFFEVTGEGNIVLESNAMDGMTVLVSGPVSSFPEAEELSVSVSSVPEEMKPQVEEALKKRAEEEGFDLGNYRALDIRLYADGEETEPTGEIQVSFKNMELTEQVDGDTQISRTAVKAAVNEDAAEGAPQSNEEAGIALLSNDAESTAVKDSENIKVYHLDEEETVANEMESSVEDNGDVVMTTDHFSVYIVVETGDETVDTVTLKVQHWANIKVLAENPEASLNGRNTEKNTYKLVHNDTRTEIYSTDELEVSNWTSVDIADLSKVAAKGAYTISGVYVLKDGQTEIDNVDNTTVWENITNNERYTVKKNSTIRIVYEPLETYEKYDATFYDYNVRSGNSYLINNSANFDSSATKYLGFGNISENAYTAYYQAAWGGSRPGKFNHDYNIYHDKNAKVPWKFVDGFDVENNQIIYKDGVVDAGLFDGSSPSGKKIYQNYDLNFRKNGDTYVLTNVYRNNEKLFGSDYELDGFHFESTNSGGIYTNGFWCMDNDTGTDGKKSSLDGKNHNWFFGMRYDFQFTLGDYTGPLTYYFRGDDDFWLFMDGKLVVDLGGIHDPIGEMVDLREYLDPKEDKNTPHTISIAYLERGGQASTCYMEFTIPNVASVPVIPEADQASITVNKVWNDNSNPYRPQNVNVQLYYKTTGEKSFTKTWGDVVTLNSSNNWTHTWNKLAKSGYEYQVQEVSTSSGYSTTYSPANGTTGELKDGQSKVTITNSLKDPINIAVEKIWEDGDSADRPASVNMRLYWREKGNSSDEWKPFGGSGQGTLTLDGTADAENASKWEYESWKGIYTNLPSTINYNGKTVNVEYTIFEMNGSMQITNGGSLPGKNANAVYTVSYGSSTANVDNLKNIPARL